VTGIHWVTERFLDRLMPGCSSGPVKNGIGVEREREVDYSSVSGGANLRHKWLFLQEKDIETTAALGKSDLADLRYRPFSVQDVGWWAGSAG